MIGAPNTLCQKYWVGMVQWAPETSILKEIVDIFRNYNIDDGIVIPKYNCSHDDIVIKIDYYHNVAIVIARDSYSHAMEALLSLKVTPTMALLLSQKTITTTSLLIS